MSEWSGQSLAERFGLTPGDLAERERVGQYIASYAGLIADGVYDSHLAGGRDLPRITGKADLARLKRQLRDFLVAQFQTPFDAHFAARRAHVELLQLPTGTGRDEIRAGFDGLCLAVCDLARVNDQVRDDLGVILRYLRIAEQLILAEVEGAEATASGGSGGIVHVFELLYQATLAHREHTARVLAGCGVTGAGCRCGVYPIFEEIAASGLDSVANLDLPHSIQLHETHHRAVDQYLAALRDGADAERRRELEQAVRRHSEQFVASLARPLQDISSVSFLAVSSAFRFIRRITGRAFDLEVGDADGRKLGRLLESELPQVIEETMGWCVRDVVVVTEPIDLTAYDVVTTVALRDRDWYVGVDLIDLPNRVYLIDMLQLLIRLVRFNLIGKEREAALLDLADSAERASQAKNAFLANMSHELRTPLNAIIGFAQILERRTDLPTDLQTYLGKIRVAGNNLLQLVNTILDFAKLEAGKIVCEAKATPLEPIVREAVLLTEPLARNKDIELQAPPPLAIMAHCDAQLIKQVLLNLLSNAVKFTAAGGRVTIGVEVGERLRIAVTDTGVGIAAEDMGELFSPFRQIENPMRKANQGTGLGLSISRKIVRELHGGDLTCTSTPGVGSTFTVELPVVGNPTRPSTSRPGRVEAGVGS